MLRRLIRLERWPDAALAVVLLTALFHGQSLWRGYHRWDDFAFLQMADRTAVTANVLAPHNDHLLPLWRLQVEALHALLGLAPVGYIALTLICFAAVLLLLERCLASRAVGIEGRWLTLALVSSWSSWAEFTSGYFTLTVYLQLAILFFLALEVERRARATGAARWRWLLGLLCLIAVGLDVSGFWVVVAVPVVAIADGEWRAEARRATLAAVAPSVLVCFVVFVGTAGATILAVRSWYPGLAAAGADQSVAVGMRLFVAAKVCVAILVAPWRVMGYAFPGSPIAVGALAVGGALTVVVLVRWWSRRGMADRQLALGLAGVVLIHVLMIAVGRPFVPTEFPAKHIGIPFMMFAAMVGVLLPRDLRRLRHGSLLLGGAIGFVVLAQGAANVVAARRGYPVTAKVELWLASERERSIALLRDSVIAPLLAEGVTTIPTVPVGPLEAATKDLRFYDLSVYRPFLGIPDSVPVRFVRDSSTPPSVVEAGVEVVPDAWAAAGPRFRAFVAGHPIAQRLWALPSSPP